VDVFEKDKTSELYVDGELRLINSLFSQVRVCLVLLLWQ